MDDLWRRYWQQQKMFGRHVYLSLAEKGIGEASTSEDPGASGDAATRLNRLYNQVSGCTACGLSQSRTNTVFGAGNPEAKLVLVGEAPGRDEDRSGEPFVGRAGKLLTDILKAVNLSREDVFIANVLKCRPPDNRDPNTQEVAACEPYLWQQLDIIRPKLIMALGRIAGATLLKTNSSLKAMRARIHRYQGIPLMVTYHPAALLRNPHWKYATWEDVQRMKRIYDGEESVE